MTSDDSGDYWPSVKNCLQHLCHADDPKLDEAVTVSVLRDGEEAATAPGPRQTFSGSSTMDIADAGEGRKVDIEIAVNGKLLADDEISCLAGDIKLQLKDGATWRDVLKRASLVRDVSVDVTARDTVTQSASTSPVEYLSQYAIYCPHTDLRKSLYLFDKEYPNEELRGQTLEPGQTIGGVTHTGDTAVTVKVRFDKTIAEDGSGPDVQDSCCSVFL